MGEETISRELYLHRRKTIFWILDLLREFIEGETWDIQESDEVDAIEANTVSLYYEKLVEFMCDNAAHSREDFEPESGTERAEAEPSPEGEPETIEVKAEIESVEAKVAAADLAAAEAASLGNLCDDCPHNVHDNEKDCERRGEAACDEQFERRKAAGAARINAVMAPERGRAARVGKALSDTLRLVESEIGPRARDLPIIREARAALGEAGMTAGIIDGAKEN